MNHTSPRFLQLEASLERLRTRMPDVPATGVLLSRLLLHVGRSMAGMLEQQIRPFGLAEAEFRVLTTLFAQPDGVANPSELCVRTDQSPANMSRISDALVSRELITRLSSLHDRRKMVLRITEQGEALVMQLLPALFQPLRSLFGEFSDEEQQLFASLLKRLGKRLDDMALHAPERGA